MVTRRRDCPGGSCKSSFPTQEYFSPARTEPRRAIMSKTPPFPTRRSVLATSAPAGAAIAVVLAILGGRAISAQDKYTVQVTNGLALSEFWGVEEWQTVVVKRA